MRDAPLTSPGTNPRRPASPRAPSRPRVRSALPVPPPSSQSITLAGRVIPYTLRVSPVARRMRLVIKPETGLEVIVPRGARPDAHEPFLREKGAWIVRTLERMARARPPELPPLTTGRRLPFAGRELALEVRAGATPGRFRAQLAGDTLILMLPDTQSATVRAALEVWYRRRAPSIFAARLEVANRPYGYTYGRVSIKNQKSRWGSCSLAGNLNFNWRLLLAPLPVLDYVVVHELCHLKEPNHGPGFWRLVARGCPEYAAWRRWLRTNGATLAF